ncbi:hypothetical protein FHX75_13508 [Micromonospora palomenae]|uniref:Uncharacterized protein n=1 Tax=Micromonospora palomenae TaxID=1461247 RepID=A0A561VPB8_9ACTN|nr:hypothetical protein [Micromonospora palomenae]TWG13464.1 hypothetical protein FHX75_13508 [Micromonospora palomenae]
MTYPNERRVRYVPTLAVWTVDTQQSHAGGADQLLGAMLAYATESGDMPAGCTCAPESFSYHGQTGMQASPPRVHGVFRRGGVSIYGHGTLPDGERGSVEGNASQCPHANAAGEQQAKELAKAGRWDDLYALTEAFPAAPGTLQPAEPGSKAPAAWHGEPLTVSGVGAIPDRHVHPDVRADLARLGVLAADADRLGRAAREAQAAVESAGTDARRQAAEAAAAGTPLDAAAVTRSIRERQEQAEAAQITADGTRDAVAKVRQQVADGIAERQAEWLSYLRDQAAHGLARLDLVVSELEAAVENLAEIDRVRQAVESPSAGRLFHGASMIAGNAVDAARETRQRAAEALAGLERHAAKARKAEAAQAA